MAHFQALFCLATRCRGQKISIDGAEFYLSGPRIAPYFPDETTMTTAAATHSGCLLWLCVCCCCWLAERASGRQAGRRTDKASHFPLPSLTPSLSHSALPTNFCCLDCVSIGGSTDGCPRYTPSHATGDFVGPHTLL